MLKGGIKNNFKMGSRNRKEQQENVGSINHEVKNRHWRATQQPTSKWELTAFEYFSHTDVKEQNKHNEVTSTAHPLTNDR